MIYGPTIERILANPKRCRELVTIEFNEIRKQFSAKKLYPEIDLIVQARENIQLILGDQFARYHARLVFNFSDVEKVDHIANLSSFYGFQHLHLIDADWKLKQVLDFTEWINEQHETLLKIGGPLSTAVVKSMTLRYGGNSVNPRDGILVLRYRDEYGIDRTRLYRYYHYFTQRGGDSYSHKIDLNTDISLSMRAESLHAGQGSLLQKNLSSLIIMETKVSAALDETTKVIARNLLTRKLMRLMGHKPKSKI